MSTEVSVHVRLGRLRLDYRGTREFYEKNVESLVASAARHDLDLGPVDAGVAASASAPAMPNSTSAETRDGVGAVGETDGGGDDGATALEGAVAPPDSPKAYEPSSPEFGKYVRRLGPDADSADRHVVAFAFYLWNYERRATFGMNEIEGCLHSIGRTLPDDAAAIFADLTDNKRFLEVAGHHVWRLSKKGENYVKSRLLTL